MDFRVAPHTRTSRLLQLFGFCSFAVAQPIYSVVSGNVEFLVAHHSRPGDLVAFVLFVSILIPICLFIVEEITSLAGSQVASVVHLSFLVVLLALTTLPAFNKLTMATPVGTIGLAMVFAIVVVLTSAISRGVGTFFSSLSIAALIFPLSFLFTGAVAKILIPSQHDRYRALPISSTPPIILLVFDSFTTSALLDANHEIDSVRYPNFAALAREAHWFRYATAASNSTVYALPALLTGRFPQTFPLVPSVEDYPDNLFTLLARRYEMNVVEPMTALCPRELLNKRDHPDTLSSRATALLLDTFIVYVHIVSPEALRDKLPPISHTWKGFGQVDDAGGSVGGPRNTGRNSRQQDFKDFISNIRNTDGPTLHFLHVLLPHLFYDYSVSGNFYAPRNTLDGFTNTDFPIDGDILRQVAQQRYLLQVGFVDGMLGKLLQHLKDISLYNESLIIVTADHGTSFRPGHPMRRLTEQNYSEILSIPLFVKFPAQQQGVLSDRAANGVDILPTITDVLGISVPWQVDGVSLIADDFPHREILTILDPSRKDTNRFRNFDLKLIPTFPGLNERIEMLGSGTPLEQLVIRGRYHELLGRRVHAIEVESVEDLSVEIDQDATFQEPIDLSSGFVPLYLSGRVKIKQPRSGVGYLAVAVNDTIEAVAQASSSSSTALEFRIVLPESCIRQGNQTIDVYVLSERADQGVRLLTGTMVNPYRIELHGEQIVTSDGDVYPIVQGAIFGYLSPLEIADSLVPVVGWAVQRGEHRPASDVLIFADGRVQARFPIDIERQDIADWLGAEYVTSGFHGDVPAGNFYGREISAYGLSVDRIASELNYYYHPRCEGDQRVELQRYMFYQGARLPADPETCRGLEPCVVLPNNKVVAIDTGGLHGQLELVADIGDCVHLAGWAVDQKRSAPAEAVLVFHKNRLVYTGHARIDRPQIEHRFRSPPVLPSGFDFHIPKSSFALDDSSVEIRRSDLKTLAVSKHYFAWELPNND